MENIKSLQKKSTKSKKNIKTLELPLQYSEIGLPTNQIQTYEKVSPIMKYTDINQKTQICPSNWKTSKLCRKSQNLKELLQDSSNSCSLEKWSSYLIIPNVPKNLTHNEIDRDYSKILIFVLATGKHQKSPEKVNKI